MSLVKWNGKDATGRYQYDPVEIERWNMMINTESGVIYYTSKETEPRQLIWCTAKGLTSHLHRLEQMKARAQSIY